MQLKIICFLSTLHNERYFTCNSFIESFVYLEDKMLELERICEKELKQQGFDE